MGCDRRTVKKILEEPVDKKYHREPKGSQVDIFRENIFQWLDQGLPVLRMLEKAREDPEQPYTGGKSAFYERVKKFKVLWEADSPMWNFRKICGWRL